MRSEFFKEEEFKCHCGTCGSTGKEMSAPFLITLNLLRARYERPMIISSGYRCPGYNAKVSHSGLQGPHTTGKAVDVAIGGHEAYALIKEAMQLGFTGIGVQQVGAHRFLHLDMLANGENGCPRPTVWSY
jgi:zinc D-Ala-D-Ala carboxypeptidase